MRTIPFETYKKTLADSILQSADYDALLSTSLSGFLYDNNIPVETKQTIYRKLQEEIAEENLRYLKGRVAEYSALAKGWDGEDAQPPLPEATENVENLLGACRPHDLAEWTLFPNVNGTYLLQKQHALVSIGDKQFTYWAEADGNDIGEEYVGFSTGAALKAIRTINAYA